MKLHALQVMVSQHEIGIILHLTKNLLNFIMNTINRGVGETNNKRKFASYCQLQLTQYGLRHRPVMVRSKMKYCKGGEVICE